MPHVYCKLIAAGEGRAGCTVCGRVLKVTGDLAKVHAICWPRGKVPRTPPAAPPDFSCVHRGELLRVGSCDLCGLKGQPFEVLACKVHGECSISRRHSAVKACVACPDRVTP